MTKQQYRNAVRKSKNPAATRAAIAKNARKKLGKREFQRRATVGRRR